jgi:hypothetical protein
MLLLKKSLLLIALLGITGFGVTELVGPNLVAQQDAPSRQLATRVLENTGPCVDAPLLRPFIQKYTIASLVKPPWPEPLTTPAAPPRFDAPTPAIVSVPRAPIASEERYDYSAVVRGYTLFAIPVVTVRITMTATGDLIECVVSQ